MTAKTNIESTEDSNAVSVESTALFALLADLRSEAKSYMDKGNQGSSNADYYCGKSWAYDDAADRLESILKANSVLSPPLGEDNHTKHLTD